MAKTTTTTALTTTTLDATICVKDEAGGIWWPHDTTAAEIAASADPHATALAICDLDPMRGEWRS